jgi:hypothetical protein
MRILFPGSAGYKLAGFCVHILHSPDVGFKLHYCCCAEAGDVPGEVFFDLALFDTPIPVLGDVFQFMIFNKLFLLFFDVVFSEIHS